MAGPHQGNDLIFCASERHIIFPDYHNLLLGLFQVSERSMRNEKLRGELGAEEAVIENIQSR